MLLGVLLFLPLSLSLSLYLSLSLSHHTNTHNFFRSYTLGKASQHVRKSPMKMSHGEKPRICFKENLPASSAVSFSEHWPSEIVPQDKWSLSWTATFWSNLLCSNRYLRYQLSRQYKSLLYLSHTRRHLLVLDGFAFTHSSPSTYKSSGAEDSAILKMYMHVWKHHNETCYSLQLNMLIEC
jgi:hypothetical protein